MRSTRTAAIVALLALPFTTGVSGERATTDGRPCVTVATATMDAAILGAEVGGPLVLGTGGSALNLVLDEGSGTPGFDVVREPVTEVVNQLVSEGADGSSTVAEHLRTADASLGPLEGTNAGSDAAVDGTSEAMVASADIYGSVAPFDGVIRDADGVVTHFHSGRCSG